MNACMDTVLLQPPHFVLSDFSSFSGLYYNSYEIEQFCLSDKV